MPLLSPSEWVDFLAGYPRAHLLQTMEWGELKASFGWEVARVITGGGKAGVGAQVLFRRLPLGFTLAYIPKGPLGVDIQSDDPSLIQRSWEALQVEVDRLCRQKKAVLLKAEPDAIDNRPGIEPPAGFVASPHGIQPARTILVNLRSGEQQVLDRMKQKTRYNIRLAEKKGVRVQPSADFELFYRLMQATGERDAFGVHSQEYYRRAFELFHPKGECELLVAEFEGEPLAALMVFAHGERAWYFYGASSNSHRELMPTYLLQWEAMRWAHARGCMEYDLWGVPDLDEQTLETHFAGRSDGLWGVYRFKRGFGGRICRAMGPWDRVYRPILYKAYQRWAGRRGADNG